MTEAVGSNKVLKTECETTVCQKSDYLIVVMKPVKAGGAKGVASQRDSEAKHDYHWRLDVTWNMSRRI